MRTTLAVLLTGMLVLSLAGSAEAHKTAYSPDGKIKIVWGFLNEPAVTMTKTGLDLILTDNETGAPIDGVSSATLTVEMHHGDDEFAFKDFAAQFGQHGRYTGVITLTDPGIYILHLTGTINGSDMGPDGLEIQAAHPVDDIKDTYFPALNETGAAASAAKIAQLEARIAALEAKATTQSTTPATVASQPVKGTPGLEPALGLLALAGVALAIGMKRRA